jgi:hypothetical protein
MSDHLLYSANLRNFSPLTMLRHFEKVLDHFPFSPQNPGNSFLRIEAISPTEPPLLEQAFTDPLSPKDVLHHAGEFLHPDAAYHLDTWWGLWTFDKEWRLAPARVTLSCFGPEFESNTFETPDAQSSPEHLRIEFGLESWFLPNTAIPNSSWYTRSNLKGMLKLVHTLDDVLPVERRQIWSESGANFADRLREAAAEL